MKKASEYREQAEACRQMARRAKAQEDREVLLKMAETWEELAQTREKQAKKAQHRNDWEN